MTPEKIAPLVVYLASDRAEGISGQIFSVRNNEIFLFNQPRPIRAIHRSDGWTPEASSTSSSRARSPPPSRRSSARATCSPGTRCDGRSALPAIPGRAECAVRPRSMADYWMARSALGDVGRNDDR